MLTTVSSCAPSTPLASSLPLFVLIGPMMTGMTGTNELQYIHVLIQVQLAVAGCKVQHSMSCYFRICYICVILVVLWLLLLVGLCRHFYCYLKSTPSGEPSVQTPVQGVTSGFSLKSCSPGPRRFTTINKPF